MALRYVLYFLVSLGLVGFAGVAWIAMQPPAPVALPEQAAAAPVIVPQIVTLIAARALRAGALLAPSDLAAQGLAVPAPDTVADSPQAREALIGGMIRHNLPAGAALHADDVLRSRDRGFLASVLAPGMLAVTIGVDAVTGAAGLVWPGDRVDLVLTQSNENAALPAAHRVSGETILADLRVIAIDQQLMQGAVGSEGTDRTVRTVTLEVTSAQAERIAVGNRLGKLSLAVHAAVPAASDPTPVRTPGVTWAGDVSSAVSGSGASPPAALRVYSGPEKIDEVHF